MNQIYILLLISFIWVPFIFSAFSYQHFSWFHYLLLSRICLSIIPLFFICVILKKRKQFENFEAFYFLIAMAIQASHGYLEPSNQIDFYSYTSICFLISSIAFKGDFKHWLIYIASPSTIFLVAPVLFKDKIFFNSASVFVDKFSLSVAISIATIIIARISTTKYTILEKNINLHKQLLNEKNLRLHIVENELSQAKKKIIEQSKLAAIGQTTSMLAHDVKKPFTQIQGMLNMMDKFKEHPSLLLEAKRDVEKSINNVQSMISDVMDFSREVKLETEAMPIANLLDFSIRQCAHSYKDADIDFIYKLKNIKMPLVDGERMTRVFSNIIGNGIEAIRDIGKKEKGKIEIKTEMIGAEEIEIEDRGKKNKNFIEIRIANDGPPIKEEDISKLFEAFFTKGKKKGTGLGLASCEKIVKLHGGEINVRNIENNSGVEFTINLPASEINEEQSIKNTSLLPTNIKDVAFCEMKKDESAIFKNIEGLSKNDKRFKILLLEDEALYRASVRNTIKQNEIIDNIITLYETNNIDDALKVIEKEVITHAIVDIDLGDIKNGFDFLEILKEKYPHVRSLVHTNRCIEEDKMKAEALNACGFVSKPLLLEHLVSFLVEGEEKVKVISVSTIPLIDKEIQRPRVVLLSDDDNVTRMFAEDIIKEADPNATVHIFDNGESLLEKLKLIVAPSPDTSSSESMIPTLFVLTDQNMGSGMTGLELTREIRNQNLYARIYMISNESKSYFEEEAVSAGADGYFEAPINVEKIGEIFKKSF